MEPTIWHDWHPILEEIVNYFMFDRGCLYIITIISNNHHLPDPPRQPSSSFGKLPPPLPLPADMICGQPFTTLLEIFRPGYPRAQVSQLQKLMEYYVTKRPAMPLLWVNSEFQRHTFPPSSAMTPSFDASSTVKYSEFFWQQQKVCNFCIKQPRVVFNSLISLFVQQSTYFLARYFGTAY